MITEKDLQEAIEECRGKHSPNANDCIKLAAFYTIRNELFPQTKEIQPMLTYSFADAPAGSSVVSYDSGTEFSRVIHGRKAADVWERLDKCMTELKYLNPRLYNAILDEIEK